ncbi:MAG: hypothetical protein WC548_03290 [Candidatus Pacearchaeota archaeon]
MKMKKNKQSEFEVAILGIRLGIIAIIVSLCIEIISNSTIISIDLKNLIYLIMAAVLFYFALKIKSPKRVK